MVHGVCRPEEKIAVIGFSDLPRDKLKSFMKNHKNFVSAPEFCNGCNVLTEILNDYQILRNGVDEIMKEIFNKIGTDGIKVRIVGKGYGGALANLYAIHSKAKFMVENHRILTFGAIRVGDENFAKYSNNIINRRRHYRVDYLKDPLPMVPFREKGFRHAGKQYTYITLPFIKKVDDKDYAQKEVFETIYFKTHYCYNKIWEYKSTSANGITEIDYDKIKALTPEETKILEKNNYI